MTKQTATFEAHLTELKNNYGEVVFVNLVDRKKSQKMLGDMFEKVAHEKSQFVWFDFHHECKNDKYQNLSKLLQMDNISNKLNEQNWTNFSLGNDFQFGSVSNSFNIESTQKQVFRVNCLDSLDRSNVVQCLLVRHMLQNSNISEFKAENNVFTGELEPLFKNCWADNGDQLALSYSGTNALKGDFTRTGKRNFTGLINDGVNSLKRYFINNFTDGYNQDAHDYSLGKLANFRTTKLQNHSLFLLYFVVISTLIISQVCLKLIPYFHPHDIKNPDFKASILYSIFGIGIGIYLIQFQKTLVDNSTIKH
jgi:hypothetical protein